MASSRVAHIGLLCQWSILIRRLLGENRAEDRKTLLAMDTPRMALVTDQLVHRVVQLGLLAVARRLAKISSKLIIISSF